MSTPYPQYKVHKLIIAERPAATQDAATHHSVTNATLGRNLLCLCLLQTFSATPRRLAKGLQGRGAELWQPWSPSGAGYLNVSIEVRKACSGRRSRSAQPRSRACLEATDAADRINVGVAVVLVGTSSGRR
jgi:hypothetical protein